MTTFLFIRHGETNYSLCEERAFIGHGVDLAPLSETGIYQINKISKDFRLTDAELIISSPYTRAMHSAAILSQHTGLEMKVEVDLHEWIPDKSFCYANFNDSKLQFDDYTKYDGIYPLGQEKAWEERKSIKVRVLKVLEKYLTFKKVIVVTHGMVIQTFKHLDKVDYAEIVELELP